MHTWKPDVATWGKTKHLSVNSGLASLLSAWRRMPRQALGVAVKQNNQQVARTLQEALNEYQHDDSGAKSN
jgi:hypothetical protein